MNCKKMKGLIFTDYIDGNLKGRALEETELHIRSCSSCHALAEDLRAQRKLFRAVGQEAVPSVVWHKICAEISAAPAGSHFAEDLLERLQYRLSHLKPAIVMAGAAVLLLFALAAIRLMPQKSYPGTTIAQDDILAVSYNNDEEGGPEYDLGTPAEMFFL